MNQNTANPAPAFPRRAKFCPLRRITPSKEGLGLQVNASTEYLKLISENGLAEFRDAIVFFMDPRAAHADELADLLRRHGRVPVASIAISAADFVGLNCRSALLKVYDAGKALFARGFRHLEIIFSPGEVQPGVCGTILFSCVTSLRGVGAAVAVYQNPNLLPRSSPDAVTVDNMRATRSGKFYFKNLEKTRRIPIFSTERGNPLSPGKAVIDLKAYCLTHKPMSLTLLSKETPGTDPHFFFAVTS